MSEREGGRERESPNALHAKEMEIVNNKEADMECHWVTAATTTTTAATTILLCHVM